MELQESGDKYIGSFSRGLVFRLWLSTSGSDKERCREVIQHLIDVVPDAENVDMSNLEKVVKYICIRLVALWKSSSRKKDIVLSKHSKWLNEIKNVNIPKTTYKVTQNTSLVILDGQSELDAAAATRRPKKDFAACSSRSKRRRLAALAQLDESAVSNLTDTSDSVTSEVKPDDVLSLITEAKLTKHQYLLLREFINSRPNSNYKLETKKWQARSDEDKKIVALNMKKIQQQFREKLGLNVDKPRSGGSGTSNDGNTARRFFRDPAVSAEITGIQQSHIERCATILEAFSSGYKINVSKFDEYAKETAKLLVTENPWYPLSASVHKVLIHGAVVIENALVSIGELSEEAAESTNKNIKSFRLSHTRKTSRLLTNTDLLNRLLLNSDPLITSIRKLPCKNKSFLSTDVMSLLLS